MMTHPVFSIDDGHDLGVYSDALKRKKRRLRPPDISRMAAGEWIKYEGPKGGTGWQNTQTGEVAYQENMPGDNDGEAEPEYSLTAAALHKKYTDVITDDNTENNNIWLNVGSDKEMASALAGIGAQPSYSKEGMMRIKNNAQNIEALDEILGEGPKPKEEEKPPESPTGDASAESLNEEFPEVVAKDNTGDNNLWLNVENRFALASELVNNLGGTPSESKSYMVRVPMDGADFGAIRQAIIDNPAVKKSPSPPKKTKEAPPVKTEPVKTEPVKKAEEPSPSLGPIETIDDHKGHVGNYTAEQANKHLNTISKQLDIPVADIRSAISSASSPKNSKNTSIRRAVSNVVLKDGLHVQGAAVQYSKKFHDPQSSSSFARSIGHGDLERIAKEYHNTPLYDLQVLSEINSMSHPVGAHCYMGQRSVTMGSTSATGDFRHELGHAVHGLLLGTEFDKWIEKHYAEVMKRVKAQPTDTKMSYDFYEDNYGVIGSRGLDNSKEDFAEHYRGFHRELYRDIKEGGGGERVKKYRKRHPMMSRIFDARYTIAMMAAMSEKGEL